MAQFIAWTNSEPPVPRMANQTMQGQGYVVTSHPLAFGHFPPPVKCKTSHCLWLMKGEISITKGDQKFLLKTGDRFLADYGEEYAITKISETGALYLLGQKKSA